MYNLENTPIELIRCLELGLPMPGGLLQRFPLVVLEEWRRQWMEGPGRQITEDRKAIELERLNAEIRDRERLRHQQMAYWIEPGSIVTINAPRTSLDQRKAIVITIGNDYSNSSARISIDGNEVRLSACKLKKQGPQYSLDKDCHEKR